MFKSESHMYVLLVAVVGLVQVDAPAGQTSPSDKPVKSAQPAGMVMGVDVVSVTGSAQKLVVIDGKKTWQGLQAGEKLDERTVIRTGFRSKVVLKFQDRGLVEVRNATKMGIGEFRNAGGKTRTRLGIKYGTVRASVDSSRGPQDWKIKTPVSTLSIRGTSGEIAYGSDCGMGLHSTSGKWHIASGVRKRNIRPTEIISTRRIAGAAATLANPIEVTRLKRELTAVPMGQGLSRTEKKMLRNQDSSNTLLSPITRTRDWLRRRSLVTRLTLTGAGKRD